MDLNYIKEFVLLANINNFQEAADSLYISQSTLSRHIQTLEKELQNKLFDRTTRTVRLSEFGRFFLPYAQDMICIEQDFYNEFYQVRNVFDFALIHEPESMDKRLQKMPFVHDWLTAAVPDSHPLARQKSVSLFQMKNESFLTMPMQSTVSRTFLSACRPYLLFVHNPASFMFLF